MLLNEKYAMKSLEVMITECGSLANTKFDKIEMTKEMKSELNKARIHLEYVESEIERLLRNTTEDSK